LHDDGETGLQVNAEKIKCTFMSHRQNIEEDNIKIFPRKYREIQVLENVSNKFKLQSQKIKSRLCSQNAYCHSVRNILSSRILSKDITNKI